jgi:hypothetical protein
VNDITTLDAGKPNPAKPSSALAAQDQSRQKRDTHLLAAMLYEGYSPFSQAVSELSSIGAPTLESCSTPLWLADRIRSGWTVPARRRRPQSGC